MVIRSVDGTAQIEIVLNDPKDEFSDFTLIARKNDSCGFSGKNDRVVFARYGVFLDALEELFTNRNGEATLQMSEQCLLSFFRWNAIGDIGVKATISKFAISTDTNRADSYRAEFEFKIDGEFLNSLIEDFRRLAPWG
jgi:hypothetical protein